jgi:hypothetical protein
MQRKVSGRGSGIAFIEWQIGESITGAGRRENQIFAWTRSAIDFEIGQESSALIDCRAMPDQPERRKNLASWWGLLLALGAIGCNAVLFVGSSAQSVMPALSLVFAAGAIIFLGIGLKCAFGQPQFYHGKVLSVVLVAVALLPVAITAFAFVVARKLPSSTAAPQVGQKVPDFTLADTSGKPVSLDQLLSGSSGAPAPKAVLLIFYRGYW